MNIEGHYWCTAIVAKAAGYADDDVKKLAYAAQFVDNNSIAYHVCGKASQDTYDVQISQTMDILKPSAELEKIYTHVHFLPGVPDAPTAARKDGKTSLLNTTPNSPRSQIIFGQALASDSVHQIGVATHMYFDTWAHQNFLGTTDHMNGMRDPKNLAKSAGKKALPNVGHADAAHDPDIIAMSWDDDRLVDSHISNRQRHLDAFEAAFRAMRATKLGASAKAAKTDPKWSVDNLREQLSPAQQRQVDQEWATLRDELIGAIGPEVEKGDPAYNDGKAKKQRIAHYKQLLGADFPEYDETKWRDEALKLNFIAKHAPPKLSALVRDFPHIRAVFNALAHVTWKDPVDYKKTDFYKFQKGVDAHMQAACKQLEPVYAKMGRLPPKA